MVKFTKQFEGQLIPEWKEAFVDYWQLKKYVQKIHRDSTSPTSKPIQKSSLTNSLCTCIQKLSLFGNQRRDREFIHVHSKVAWTTNKGVLYQTELLEQSDHNEAASAFFALLDLQLNQIMKLADEVEEIFVKQFAEDDRRKAMKYLKPTQCKESHSVTFFIGLFTGCFIALLIGYAIIAHTTGTYGPQSNTVYMETVYPLLSMFSLLFLHLFLYGCNIYMWRKNRINYSFIFELSPRKELKYSDVFLISTFSMTVVVGVLFVHMSLMDKGYSYSQVDLIPGLLLLCARRWLDEGDTGHLINLGKYASAMLAAGAKLGYEQEKSVGWLCVVVIMSSIATVYQLYWDFVKDWGLLQMNSKNPWLRNELILRQKFIYFFSMHIFSGVESCSETSLDTNCPTLQFWGY